ncbi:MAG TPA: C25 family peptidase propeptide domain-containing protein, partial [Candidatus Edwardsbacteria bacterium]|nr:C25 family peptidase propeptide domain-containing protein [Candidatus Edwardsbacteria bacterium]
MKYLTFAVVLLLAATAWAGELVQTITFDQNQLRTLSVGQYQLLAYPGYATSSDPGKPSLPQVVQSLALPAGAVITGVKVIAQDERPLPGSYDIAPAQHASPLPMPGRTFSYAAIPPDQAVYGADQVYPQAPVVALGSGTMCGYSIGRVEIYPVRYNPVARTAFFTSSLTYAVSYQLNKAAGTVPTQFQQETFGKAMRSFVANP